MLSHLREYHRPKGLPEALRLLARPDIVSVPLAGGTRLVAAGVPGAEAVVDLHDAGLNTMEAGSRGLRMGATVTLQTIVDDPRSSTFAGGVLAEATRRSAPRNIRNVATVGGTVVTADPLDELLLVLLALDSQVTLADPMGRRSLALARFLAEPAPALPRGTLVVELVVPAPPHGFGTGLARVASTPADRPIVAAAAAVVAIEGRCAHSRLALAGVAARPLRLPEIEAGLANQVLRAEHWARVGERVPGLVEPQSDFRASAGYRREMAGVVARRALQAAWEQATSEVAA